MRESNEKVIDEGIEEVLEWLEGFDKADEFECIMVDGLDWEDNHFGLVYERNISKSEVKEFDFKEEIIENTKNYSFDSIDDYSEIEFYFNWGDSGICKRFSLNLNVETLV